MIFAVLFSTVGVVVAWQRARSMSRFSLSQRSTKADSSVEMSRVLTAPWPRVSKVAPGASPAGAAAGAATNKENASARAGNVIIAAACAGVALASAPPAHADVYSEFYDAVDWLGKKYGVAVFVGAEPMASDTYAATEGITIYLNSSYIAYPNVFYSDVAEDQQSGYHRSARCTAPQAVAAHEFAHVLDNLTNHSARTELLTAIRNGFDGEVSGYALESPGEAIAESFAAVECDVPTPAEQAIYNMLVN